MKLCNRAVKAGALVVFAVSITPMPAFAEESAGGPAILIPNMAEFIPALVAFIIIWAVMAKVGWPKIMSMMEERSRRIADSLEEAERTKQKAIDDRHASDELVADARRQAAEIVLAARQDAEHERARIIAAAHTEAEEIISKARANAEDERRSLYAEAAGTIADLSVSVASKIVEKTLDEDGEQRRLIERYIKEVGSLNAD